MMAWWHYVTSHCVYCNVFESTIRTNYLMCACVLALSGRCFKYWLFGDKQVEYCFHSFVDGATIKMEASWWEKKILSSALCTMCLWYLFHTRNRCQDKHLYYFCCTLDFWCVCEMNLNRKRVQFMNKCTIECQTI